MKLGNLNTSRDWGWAPEYVEAMHLMLQAKKPDDFIIATGETNSLKNFVKLAFDYFGLNYKDHLKYDETLLRPSDVHYSSLDPSKIKKELGWEAETDFKNIIRKMYEEI